MKPLLQKQFQSINASWIITENTEEHREQPWTSQETQETNQETKKTGQKRMRNT